MKKNNILAVFAIIMTAMTGLAQTPVTIHSQNTEPTSIDAYDIEGFEFERAEEQATAIDEWIDLGLPSGVLWRSSNFGSGHPTASGTYIPYKIWKEIERDYLAEICDYRMRTPGPDDIGELFANCTVEKDEIDGVVGVKFIGPTGNSIFLPAAGVHYADDSDLWRNVICAYWAFEHNTNVPIYGWSFNAANPVGNLTGPNYFNHPLHNYGTTPEFCLYVRPVKDTATDENVIYDCQDWPSYELENETENTVVFEVVASKKPVISCEDDFVSWEISEGEEVAIPENFDDYFNGNPRTFDGSFRKWTVTFTLQPNPDTWNWRSVTVTFKGRVIPWGPEGTIRIRQAPGV